MIGAGVRAIWGGWLGALREEEPGWVLALVRIGVGLVVALDLGWFGWTGGMELVWGDAREIAGALRPVGWEWGEVRLIAGGTAAAALAMAAGIWPRWMAMIALQGCLALYGISPIAGGGHDRVATNALWILCWADSGRAWSVASWWRARRAEGEAGEALIPAWPRWLLILQLCVIYSMTGVQKLGVEWTPSGGLRAVHNMLMAPVWTRWDLAPILDRVGPLTMAAAAISWLWEVSFGLVGLWLARRWWRERRAGESRGRAGWDLRTGYALIGVGFHLTLWAVASLGPFSPIMLALYPALFRPADWGRGGGVGQADKV